MKNFNYLLFAFLFLSFVSNAQDNAFGAKLGYVITNAYYPDGNLVLYTDGSGGQGNNSFSYKSGFQLGLFKEIPLKSTPGYIYIAGQYVNYGFNDNDLTVDLNYIELDINGVQKFGKSDKFLVGFGLSPAYLISNSNEIEIDSKFDIRANTIIGFKLSNTMKLFFQGKIGFLKLNSESELKSYLLSLNTEISIFNN